MKEFSSLVISLKTQTFEQQSAKYPVSLFQVEKKIILIA